MNSKTDIINQIAQSIIQAKTIAICGHIMPDGDCLGSELALGIALKKMGKEVLLCSPDPIPDTYSFLPCVKEIIIQFKKIEEVDLFISVDCSVPDRLGVFKDYMTKSVRVITVDHHAGAEIYGDIYLNDPTAAAAGEIVFDILKVLPVEMDRSIATCLYVAIVTDTGSFRYDNTGPSTHLTIAHLLRTGIPSAEINKKLYEEKPLVSLRILEKALGTLQLSTCGRIAWMHVTREAMNELKAQDEHVDGIINYPRMVKGVEVAIFFREVEKDHYKISFRSKYKVDVNKLAAIFGGGGHSCASGCVIKGPFEIVQMQVFEAALDALGEIQ